MVDLFLNRVLVENNWDQDELNTEREIVGILENRITLLFFASAACQKCQEFLPVLNDFFKRLKDPAYIEYPKLLALIFIRSFFFLNHLFYLNAPDKYESQNPVFKLCDSPCDFHFYLLSPA